MISVLFPTRYRPELAARVIATATQTASRPLEFVLRVDADDAATYRAAGDFADVAGDGTVTLVVERRHSVPMSDMWNQCAARATRDVLAFVDDEAMFRTVGWDERVTEVLRSTTDRLALVHPDDRVHSEGDAAGYFLVHRRWLEVLGRLTPPMFTYGYADVWCIEVARAAGRYVWCPDVIIENTAPANQPPDVVHRENYERAVRDRPGDLYLTTQRRREADVDRLLTYISTHREHSS